LTAAGERPGEESAAPPALPAGRVGRPHGLDGSFYVTRAKPRLLVQGTTVSVDGRALKIVRRAGTDAHPILRLEGLGARGDAERLRGQELTVAAEAAPALGEGEWWAHELEGCEVRDGARLLGVVSRLLELPSCEVLEVRPAGGGEPLLVPMVRDAIRAVEPARRCVDVDASFLGLEEA
jgi:16S rRNA processing protein RimM